MPRVMAPRSPKHSAPASVPGPAPTADQRSVLRRTWPVLAALVVAALVTWLMLGGAGVPRETAYMAGIFVLAALLWVSEALPLFATSLLVIGLQIVLLANPGGWAGFGFEGGGSPSYRSMLSTAADPVLVLFFGGFVLGSAAVKAGVDRAMSELLLRPFGQEPRWILLGVMLVTLLFGMWMSNTATTAMMLAIVTPMLAGLPAGEPFRKALVLGVPFTANISGMGTPIASPPNAVVVSSLRDAGYTVGFLDWMLMALPLTVGLTLFAWLILGKIFAPTTPGLRFVLGSEKLTARGWLVVGVFTVTVLLWMSEGWHGLPPAVVALLPAVALTTTGIFTREDLKNVEWNILLLIAGGISLGAGMQLTGLDQVIVGWLPAGTGGFGLLALVTLGAVALGTFMSNTATANLFLPIGLSAAAAAPASDLHPIQIGVSIALASAMSMALPMSTPPNAMAYARGEFSAREMLYVSLPLITVAILAIIFGGGLVMRLCGLID